MFGQPASWQTVCRPSLFTSFISSLYSGPILALVLIHSGLRSIGVSALRTSSRRSLRPFGAVGDSGPAGVAEFWAAGACVTRATLPIGRASCRERVGQYVWVLVG